MLIDSEKLKEALRKARRAIELLIETEPLDTSDQDTRRGICRGLQIAMDIALKIESDTFAKELAIQQNVYTGEKRDDGS